MYQFCCKDCCEDFKRLRGVVSQCEHCKQEKLLHEKIRFSGVEKNFCSEGTWGRHGRGRAPMPAHAGGGEESMERNRGEIVLARSWGKSLAMQRREDCCGYGLLSSQALGQDLDHSLCP